MPPGTFHAVDKREQSAGIFPKYATQAVRTDSTGRVDDKRRPW